MSKLQSHVCPRRSSHEGGNSLKTSWGRQYSRCPARKNLHVERLSRRARQDRTRRFSGRTARPLKTSSIERITQRKPRTMHTVRTGVIIPKAVLLCKQSDELRIALSFGIATRVAFTRFATKTVTSIGIFWTGWILPSGFCRFFHVRPNSFELCLRLGFPANPPPAPANFGKVFLDFAHAYEILFASGALWKALKRTPDGENK